MEGGYVMIVVRMGDVLSMLYIRKLAFSNAARMYVLLGIISKVVIAKAVTNVRAAEVVLAMS